MRVVRSGGNWRQQMRRWWRRNICWRRGVVVDHDSVEVVQRVKLVLQGVFITRPELESLAPSQERAVLEHGNGLGMQGPVGTLAGPVGAPGDLDEAVVEAEVVPQGVLPSLGVLLVVGEVLHDEAVDL